MKKGIVLAITSCLVMINLAGCGLKDTYEAFTKKNSVEAIEPSDTQLPADAVAVEDTGVSADKEVAVTNTNPMLDCLNNIESIDGTLTYAIKLQVPMTAEEKKQYESLGNDASYAFHNVNAGVEANISTTDTISHYEGTLSKVGKSIVANPINTYTDETEGIMYDLKYNEQTGSQVWVKNCDYTKSLYSIITEVLAGIKNPMENTSSTTRIIKGTTSSKAILQIPCFDNINNEYFTLDKTIDTDLPVKVTINAKTGYLAALEVDLDALISATGMQTYSTEPLRIIVKNTNSTLIAIPEEALNTTGEELATTSADISVYDKYFKSIYAPNSDDATDDVSVAIIQSVIGNQYNDILKNGEDYTEVVHKVTDFLNYYSVEDLQEYMQYFKYCSEEEQASICIVAQLGIPGFDEAYMQANCIGNMKLSTIINDYMDADNIVYTTNNVDEE